MAVLRMTTGREDIKRRTPLASLALAYAATVPILAGASASLVLEGDSGEQAKHLTIRWSAAVLCFLSGVRRGLSFRQPGGSTAAEGATMVSAFVIGAASCLVPPGRFALSLLLVGFGGLGAADVRAGRTGEAPAYFSRLRPAQMLISLVGLGAMLARRPRSRAPYRG